MAEAHADKHRLVYRTVDTGVDLLLCIPQKEAKTTFDADNDAPMSLDRIFPAGLQDDPQLLNLFGSSHGAILAPHQPLDVESNGLS